MMISKIVVKKEDQLVVNLTYKGKNTGCITSRRPSFEIASFLEGKIGFDPIVEIDTTNTVSHIISIKH